MIVRFAKGKKAKPGTFTCLRDDGSCVWQPMTDYFAYHDLVHFAVETTLGYKQAFLGLVAQGRALDSFGTKNGVKDVYTGEETWAEIIAGKVQFPAYSGGPLWSDDELLAILVKTCTDREVPVPPITAEQLGQIRALARSLHRRWEALPEGETLELLF